MSAAFVFPKGKLAFIILLFVASLVPTEAVRRSMKLATSRTSRKGHVEREQCANNTMDSNSVSSTAKVKNASWGSTKAKASGDVEDTWSQWMKNPPLAARDAEAALAKEADLAVGKLMAKPVNPLGDIDVVYSGGGNLDAYALGVSMVLSRLEQRSRGGALRVQRYAGASAGGMTAFELALKGEVLTVASKIAYHMLTEKSSWWSRDQASHEKQMAKWMMEKYKAELPLLDDKVYLALSCFSFSSNFLEMVHKYTSPEQARKAFLITGAMGFYEGKPCADGSSASGKKMTPLFKDHMRPQLIVNLMAWGDGLMKGVMKRNATLYQERISKGIAEAAEFFGSRTSSNDEIAVSVTNSSITFCPQDAKVDDGVCKDKNAKKKRGWW